MASIWRMATIALSIVTAGCSGSGTRVILLMADGAGIGHWTLALHAHPDLALRQFPVSGLMDTRGANHVVTGSAAGATALATGVRTFFGAISVGPDSASVETVVERAMAHGLSTGVMTTTNIWDATPAAFSTHATQRSQVRSISTQMARKGMTVMMGGGRRAFELPMGSDSATLVDEIRNGYTYVETPDQFYALDLDTVTALAGLFARGDMGPVAGRSPALPDLVEAALQVLDKDPDGFFLLVENEETDSRAHANDSADVLVADILAFDAAIAVALRYRERHPETLIVVAGDHETGGITLPPDSVRDEHINYSTGDHTGAMIPVFAIGPGAERFGGIIENRQVGRLLLEAVSR